MRQWLDRYGPWIALVVASAAYYRRYLSPQDAGMVLYPQAAAVFWTLGLITAILRYLMDAHWPSDVLAGIAIGYVVGHLMMTAFKLGPLTS